MHRVQCNRWLVFALIPSVFFGCSGAVEEDSQPPQQQATNAPEAPNSKSKAAVQPIDLAELNRQFAAWRLKYDRWAKPLQDLSQEYFRESDQPTSLEEFLRQSQELQTKLLAEYNPFPELYKLFDQLCPAYRQADAPTRRKIRKLVATYDLNGEARQYADHQGQQIKGPQDIELLRNALAAIAIEDCRSDFRDTLTVLADLYVGAEQVGIDPEPEFIAAGGIASTDVPTGGHQPVSQLLREFTGTAILLERRSMKKPYRDSTFSDFDK